MKNKDIKLKCDCGCGMVLYICSNTTETLVTIGSEENARKGFKNFRGVVVNKKDLLDIIN